MAKKIIKAIKKIKPKPPIKQKYISTPEILWDLFCQFVEHERNSPMYKVDYVGRDGEMVKTPLMVPITFEGFECWLQDKNYISQLGDYSSNKGGKYEAYSTIITRIRQNCFSQNFKGAAVGLFNSNLIAKKLGLVDKQSISIEKEQPLLPDK